MTIVELQTIVLHGTILYAQITNVNVHRAATGLVSHASHYLLIWLAARLALNVAMVLVVSIKRVEIKCIASVRMIAIGIRHPCIAVSPTQINCH